jgi:predicted negative regulator of RcsB-dependent stress response
MAFETDEQQAEALKLWWRENGKQVIFGALIGLVGVFGWQYWNKHLDQVSASAAEALDRMQQQVGRGELEQAQSQGQAVLDLYTGTIYADLAALKLAALQVQQNKPAEAEANLKRVIDHSRDTALKDLAKLRLARLYLSQNKLAEAEASLGGMAKAWASEAMSIKGDIAAAKSDWPAARKAWESALEGPLADTQMLQLKIDNLPGS